MRIRPAPSFRTELREVEFARVIAGQSRNPAAEIALTRAFDMGGLRADSSPSADGFHARLAREGTISGTARRLGERLGAVDSPQGEALRGYLAVRASPSGRSVEEQVRSGAYLYAHTDGSKFWEVLPSRDPDGLIGLSEYDVGFYLQLRDGRVMVDLHAKSPRLDQEGRELRNAFKRWLKKPGGGLEWLEFTDGDPPPMFRGGSLPALEELFVAFERKFRPATSEEKTRSAYRSFVGPFVEEGLFGFLPVGIGLALNMYPLEIFLSYLPWRIAFIALHTPGARGPPALISALNVGFSALFFPLVDIEPIFLPIWGLMTAHFHITVNVLEERASRRPHLPAAGRAAVSEQPGPGPAPEASQARPESLESSLPRLFTRKEAAFRRMLRTGLLAFALTVATPLIYALHPALGITAGVFGIAWLLFRAVRQTMELNRIARAFSEPAGPGKTPQQHLAAALKPALADIFDTVRSFEALRPSLPGKAPPRHLESMAHVEKFLEEVLAGERSKWSLPSMATHVQRGSEEALRKYRRFVWNLDPSGLEKLKLEEAMLTEMRKLLGHRSGEPYLPSEDLEFLKDEARQLYDLSEFGVDEEKARKIAWKLGELRKENKRTGRLAAAAAVMTLADIFEEHLRLLRRTAELTPSGIESLQEQLGGFFEEALKTCRRAEAEEARGSSRY